MFSEFRRNPAVFKNCRIKGFRVIRLHQFHQVSAVRTVQIGVHHADRIPVGARCQFHRIKIRLVQRNIFRTDEIGVAEILLLPAAVPEIIVTDAAEFLCVVHCADFLFMRDEIVMKIVGGTVIQASAVRQQIKAFSIVVAP